MKIRIIFVLIFFFNKTLSAQINESAWLKDSTFLKAKAQKLKELYTLSTSGMNTVTYQKLFFQEFPNTFAGLVKLYGHADRNKDVEDTSVNILYFESTDHIYSLFNNLRFIPDEEYYTKIIKLSFNGHWQSDAVSAFEVGVEEHFIQNPSFAFKMLSNFSDKDIHSFWYLYFDGPHPPEQTPPEFFEMKKSFPKVFNIMLKALKKVQKDNPHHH